MTTTTTLMEFRSCMMFECKTSSLGIIDSPEKQRTADMTLQQPQQSQQEVPTEGKSPQRATEQQRDFDMVESPASSPGTSMASSPALPTESANSSVMNVGYVMRIPDMGEPSSEEDSESIPNDLSNYHNNHEEMPSPLAQLQCALEKNGLLGQRLNIPSYPTAQSDVIRDGDRNGQSLNSMEEKGGVYEGCAEMYKCHLCSYTGHSKFHFNSHMNTHFDHKCPFCDYTSRTEGRLKRHVKDFHSETPPDSWAGTRVPRLESSSGEQSMDDSVSSTGNGKPRTYRCKQCNFVAIKKNDFWEHNKTHIRAEKLLTCPQCPFVTEYKHHLEYHIRNHFGSKPFKCNKCNYSCVNKSMLNSHMKSHSNIYQYRCADCSYATKYCHSLKLHLRKYEHKPASVLNVDGTPNPYPIIDVYGTRRGPRPKKGKAVEDSHINQVNSQALVVSQPSINYSTMSPFVPSGVMYSPQFFNGYQNGMMLRPPRLEGPGQLQPQEHPHFSLKHGNLLKCVLCEFSTDRPEIFHKHMLLHATSENLDLIKIYGINSESILQFQEQQMALSHYVQNQRRFGENGMQFRKNGIYSFDPESIIKHTDSEDPQENCVSSEQKLANERTNDLASLCEGNTPVIKSETDTNGSSEPSVQPEISVPSFSPQLNRKQTSETEKPEVVSSVIVSHKTPSDSPVSPKSPVLTCSTNDAEKSVDVPEFSSPLDLSSTKANDNKSSVLRMDNEESSDGTRSCGSSPGSNPPVSTTTAVNDTPCIASNSDSQSPCQPRNRRKGKAFKIDHYIHFENQNQFRDYPVAYSPDLNVTEKEEFSVKNGCYASGAVSPNNIPQNSTGSSSPYPTCAGVSQRRTSQETLRESPKFLSTQNTILTEENGIVSQYSKSKGNLSVPISSPSQSTSTAAFPSSKGLPLTHTKKRSTISGSTFSSSQSVKDKGVPKDDQERPETAECPMKWNDPFTCSFCDMAFRDSVMFAMHMGYHGLSDPFTCNMCGQRCKDKVDFFLHIARAAHL